MRTMLRAMRQILTRLICALARNRLNLCLALSSIVISLVVTEISYRVYLSRMLSTSQHDRLDVNVVNKSCWEYDERLGFHYKPSTSCDWVTIKNSLPSTSGTLFFNRRGNSGPDTDDANCEVKIAVVGDSFTVLQHDGMTWPYLLQKELREISGRKVAVYNFARDGYGILQMMDQASMLVEEKPDVILIAFISYDFVRDRFWVTERKSPGGVDVFTSTTPSLQFDKPETYTRTTLVNPLATRKWAEETKANNDRNDPVLRSILDTYLLEKKNYAVARFEPWSLRAWYLWERIAGPHIRAHGNVNSGISYDNYAADDRFMKAVAKLKQSRIPVYLIHLPYYKDLAFGRYIMDDRQTSLLSSLVNITGFPLVKIPPPTPLYKNADTMILSPDNPHPSMIGLTFYAHQIAQFLSHDATFDNFLVPPGRTPGR